MVVTPTGTITIPATCLAVTQAAPMELKTTQNPTPTGMTTLGLENEVPVPMPSLFLSVSSLTRPSTARCRLVF